MLTDNSGWFSFLVVPQGLVNLVAEAKGFVAEWPIDRRPDDPLGSFAISAPTRDLEVRLLPTSSVHGTLRDEAGRPIANVQVRLWSAKVYGQGFTMTFYNQTAATGPDGSFAFRAISPGDYFLNTEPQPCTLYPGGRGSDLPARTVAPVRGRSALTAHGAP